MRKTEQHSATHLLLKVNDDANAVGAWLPCRCFFFLKKKILAKGTLCSCFMQTPLVAAQWAHVQTGYSPSGGSLPCGPRHRIPSILGAQHTLPEAFFCGSHPQSTRNRRHGRGVTPLRCRIPRLADTPINPNRPPANHKGMDVPFVISEAWWLYWLSRVCELKRCWNHFAGAIDWATWLTRKSWDLGHAGYKDAC